MNSQCEKCAWLDRSGAQIAFWCLNSKTHPIDKDNIYIKPLGVIDFNPTGNCEYFKHKCWWRFWRKK